MWNRGRVETRAACAEERILSFPAGLRIKFTAGIEGRLRSSAERVRRGRSERAAERAESLQRSKLESTARPDATAPVEPSSRPGSPSSWFEAVGREPERLRRFYALLFGWPEDASDPLACRGVRAVGAGLVFSSAASGSAAGSYAGIEEVDEKGGGRGGADCVRDARGEARRIDAFYVEVEDVGVAISRARALGGRLLVPATRLADATIAVIADPEDHPIGLSRSC